MKPLLKGDEVWLKVKVIRTTKGISGEGVYVEIPQNLTKLKAWVDEKNIKKEQERGNKGC